MEGMLLLLQPQAGHHNETATEQAKFDCPNFEGRSESWAQTSKEICQQKHSLGPIWPSVYPLIFVLHRGLLVQRASGQAEKENVTLIGLTKQLSPRWWKGVCTGFHLNPLLILSHPSSWETTVINMKSCRWIVVLSNPAPQSCSFWYPSDTSDVLCQHVKAETEGSQLWFLRLGWSFT